MRTGRASEAHAPKKKTDRQTKTKLEEKRDGVEWSAEEPRWGMGGRKGRKEGRLTCGPCC
jgi:hypothetical protein